MNSILTIDKIPQSGHDMLGAQYVVGDDVCAPTGILVRSSSMLEMRLPETVLAVSRAGSGVNHIPCERLAEAGVVVMNTPGANAAAVAEAAIAAMIVLSRRVYESTEWLASLEPESDIAGLAEMNKTRFKGKGLAGQRLGLIGLGATGQALGKIARAFGMEIWGYKPVVSDEFRASSPSYIGIADCLEDLLEKSDFVSLHAPSSRSTHGMICAESIAKMKPGAFLINFARAELVDRKAIVDSIIGGHVAGYFTDFPSKEYFGIANIISTPHIGGKTAQASDNCAVMAARQLKDYLERGSIGNSVSYPTIILKDNFVGRVCILHRSNSEVQERIMVAAKKDGIKPLRVASDSKGDYGYTVIDVEKTIHEDSIVHIRHIPELLRVRCLHHK